MNSLSTLATKSDYWLIVDTVRIPDVMDVLREKASIKRSLRLFAGSDLEHLIEQSPLIINLGQTPDIRQYLSLPGFSSSSVVFELSQECDEKKSLTHWQTLLLANIESHPCLLRFYTPAFWQPIKNELNDADLKTLLGPSTSVIWINENGQLEQVIQREKQEALPKTPYILTSEIFKSWV